MTAFLFRFRGELLASWGVAALFASWPPEGCAASAASLIAGLALRAWARRHIGPHSRGRELSCPERSVSGPYRFFAHPLYLANTLVVASLSLVLAGPGWRAALLAAGPVVLWAFLARAETAFVRSHPSPERSAPHDARSGRWRSEWASTLPQIAAWCILQFLSSP